MQNTEVTIGRQNSMHSCTAMIDLCGLPRKSTTEKPTQLNKIETTYTKAKDGDHYNLKML
jgi:hypothetical protein